MEHLISQKNLRTSFHRNAYVKYWRLKKYLSLDDNGGILFQQKGVKSELKSVVDKALKKSKSVGY